MQISLFGLPVKLQRGNYVYQLAHGTAVCRDETPGTGPISIWPTLKHVTFYGQEFCCEHDILTEGLFVTELSGIEGGLGLTKCVGHDEFAFLSSTCCNIKTCALCSYGVFMCCVCCTKHTLFSEHNTNWFCVMKKKCQGLLFTNWWTRELLQKNIKIYIKTAPTCQITLNTS